MSEAPLRILSLGDSYTIGEGVAPAERWPMQLATRLRAEGRQIADPLIIARTGWTTAELRTALDESAPGGRHDLVTLQIGVNDQYRGGSAASYGPSFASLLDRSLEHAGGDPGAALVLSIPDWGGTPFARDRDAAVIAREIDAFNLVNREICDRLGVPYIDVTSISRLVGDPSMLAADGLHPSGAMYALWVDAAISHARECLDPERPRSD